MLSHKGETTIETVTRASESTEIGQSWVLDFILRTLSFALFLLYETLDSPYLPDTTFVTIREGQASQ